MIPDKIIDEIIDTAERLDDYLKESWDGKFDFHYHSQGGYYFLSSIFYLTNSNWYLVQGEFDFENKENHYYHSWIQKENIIFGPTMRVVTLDLLYSEFFLSKYYYQKEEIKPLLKRTGVFTYYEEDLIRGCISPSGKLVYYDTKRLCRKLFTY